ncbi:hypothetical protein BVRB_8g194270 [Beta vulgaris subsp. vulgaris]|nr:hypothetical protein BVRB_8g194270 [Beta vulgaris subsp. vulgaris]
MDKKPSGRKMNCFKKIGLPRQHIIDAHFYVGTIT